MRPLSDLADDILRALLKAIEARDAYTREHMGRTAALAQAVGRRLGLADDHLEAIGLGALLHDVGKIGIPDAILNKPGPLSDRELEIMKRHPVIGHCICEPMRPSSDLLRAIRNHHERLDGSGYPDGLRGDQIPLAARVVAVTEAYDAMCSDRPYRAALGPARACEVLESEARRGWWDAEIVAAAIREARPGLPSADRRPTSSSSSVVRGDPAALGMCQSAPVR